MTKPTYGSLFSGIGGIDLGLDRAGFHCKWQCEIDDYAQKVLAKHWPNVARFRDVRTVGAHNLPSVDLIAGGFPCQDISVAGKRAGITGERSGLWKEFYRIICELRPRFVLVENVAALLYGGIDTVLADLATCGYDAEWQVLSAAQFGAPHLRNRVFIVAYPSSNRRDGWQHEQESQPTCSSTPNLGTHGQERYMAYTCSAGREEFNTTAIANNQGYVTWRNLAPGNVSHTNLQRTQIQTSRIFTAKQKPQCDAWWSAEPELGRVANGVPSRVDRLRGLGNAVVPQCAEFVGRCIMAAIQADREVAV